MLFILRLVLQNSQQREVEGESRSQRLTIHTHLTISRPDPYMIYSALK